MKIGRLLVRMKRTRTIRAALQPAWQIEPMAQPSAGWRSTGDDPQFSCRSAAFPLRGGWYELSLEFESLDDKFSAPRLYFDYGRGLGESRSITLNFVRPSAKRHAGVVLLPRDVVALRLDPAIARCEFRMRRLRLRRLSRARAAFVMLRDSWSRRAALGGRVGWLGKGVGKVMSGGGKSAFATWLYSDYLDRGVEHQSYDHWLTLFDQTEVRPLEEAIAPGRRLLPLFSIVMPTYNTPERWLRRCLDTVIEQTYPRWELCIADDASTKSHVRSVLSEYAARDKRIQVVYRNERGHISAASNSALALARGDFAVLLDHDDELHPEALQHVAESILAHPQWKLIYSDEDKIDTQGRRFDPYFKPDWNIDLLRGHNCFSHLGVYGMDLIRDVGGFREGMEGSQDWDLVLRCAELLDAAQIGHVPRVLYHWRVLPGSTSMGVGQKNYAHVSGRRAIREHLQRRGISAEVLDIETMAGAFRVRYALPEPPPLVSIIIPTRDRVDLLKQCVDSILLKTTYPHYEIVIVDNQSTEQATLEYFARLANQPLVKIFRHDGPFNYSRINNQAVSECAGTMVCLLNNDIEVISPGWLDEMVGHAARTEIGAVGAMLYYPNDTIQHAGVVTGVQGVATHAYSGMQRGYAGYMGRALLVQSMSAVTAACLLVRRSVYEQVGGLDESFAVAFNDIDFCLRVGHAGYRNLWTPFAELYHHESASRGDEDTPEKRERFNGEIRLMMKRWAGVLENDPSYNPNLALYGEPYTLAFPPRERIVGTRMSSESARSLDRVARA